MTTFTAVTTCSAKGWEEYGSRMVESFGKFWPVEIPLLIYSEDKLPVATVEMPGWLINFKERHRDSTTAHGQKVRGYNFRWDCVKFAHTVAASKMDDGILVWLDADIVTHARVTEGWLESLFPEGPYIAWLDRAFTFPECGFYMLRCGHRWHKKIMKKFSSAYQTDQVFTFRETHDSYVLQQIIEEWRTNGNITVHSLSGDKGRATGHPLVNCPVATCLDHLKGPRKQEGRSRSADVREPRSEPYWQ